MISLSLSSGSTWTAPLAKQTGILLPAGNFARVLHDDEANDGKQRIGMPEVWPLWDFTFSDLTEAWQRFWFANLIHSYTNFTHWDETRLTKTELDALKGKWRSLTKGSEAFTNNHGTDEYHDYISGNDKSGTPKQGPITCCGNVVKVTGEATSRGTPIECLDGSRPPPPIAKVNRLTTPWLIFCATNVAADKSGGYGNWKPIILPDGRYRVDPFPQLGSRDTLVPLRSNANKTGVRYTRDGVALTINYIRTSRLVPVSDVVPRPYVP